MTSLPSFKPSLGACQLGGACKRTPDESGAPWSRLHLLQPGFGPWFGVAELQRDSAGDKGPGPAHPQGLCWSWHQQGPFPCPRVLQALSKSPGMGAQPPWAGNAHTALRAEKDWGRISCELLRALHPLLQVAALLQPCPECKMSCLIPLRARTPRGGKLNLLQLLWELSLLHSILSSPGLSGPLRREALGLLSRSQT